MSAARDDLRDARLKRVQRDSDARADAMVEVELRHAHKMESLGQLAAGIAHEINTPMQYIGDHLHFVRESLNGDPMSLPERREQLSHALDAALEGIARVSRIVQAMRSFSHPSTKVAPCDINRGLRDTLTVATNEYKMLADVQLDLGDLPPVLCNGSDLNQVFLNLVVNAAHAIETQARVGGGRGLIKVRTRCDGDDVVILISDDGCGIPEAIRHRVFDPFFTTKEVGKGTGQGLAIARSIVDRHGGAMSFDTEVGKGTTFYVRVPIAGPAGEAR
jgi:signal transduction histidine kinase